jgi:hypothetical protein
MARVFAHDSSENIFSQPQLSSICKEFPLNFKEKALSGRLFTPSTDMLTLIPQLSASGKIQ